MLSCQVYGHHTKMARTKTDTQNIIKTRRTPRRNSHSHKHYFVCISYFFINNILNDGSLMLFKKISLHITTHSTLS